MKIIITIFSTACLLRSVICSPKPQVQAQPVGNNLSFDEAPRSSMSENCLACICQASSGCALETRCINNGRYCGPFLISKPYWQDAGRQTLVGDQANRNGAFQDCAKDPFCSAQTVRSYMNKFQADCNGDRRIDCDDLGRIHLMGQSGCGDPRVPQTPFYRRFRQCLDKVNQFLTG